MSGTGAPGGQRPETPTPAGRMRSRSLVASALIIGVFAIGALFAGRFVFDRFAGGAFEDYSGEGTGSVVVAVVPGDSVTAIGNTLAGAGVVASPQAFVAATRGDPRATSIAPGSYRMRLQMSGAAAFALILDPAARYEHRVVLREGLRIGQTVETTRLATGIPQADLWTVLRDPAAGLVLPDWAPNLGDWRAEGFLFPATYTLAKDASALQVLQTYVDRFDQASAATGLADSQARVGYSPYEVLTIASLIQAEGQEQDFAKISRVIYNRLDPRTWGGTYGLLQLDATLNYYLDKSTLNLTREQMRTDTPYNTHRNAGLPPTPINSPGQSAIEAALNPAEGDWLFYVTVNPDTGETRFTDDFAQHQVWEAEFLQWCSANRDRCVG